MSYRSAFKRDRLYFRLLAALDAPGCPVCLLLLEDGRRYLDSVMYERVTDFPTREKWRRSFGLCNLHTWQLTEVSASSAPDLGFAIIAADLLKKFERSMCEPEPGCAGKRAALRRLFEKWTQRLRRKSPDTTCPACRETGVSESFHLRQFLECLGDEEFRKKYEASGGICLPHFALLARRRSRRHENFPLLRASQAAKARALRGQLEEFFERQDHRSRERLTADHTHAWRRALEFLEGKPGTFGNQLGTDRCRRYRW